MLLKRHIAALDGSKMGSYYYSKPYASLGWLQNCMLGQIVHVKQPILALDATKKAYCSFGWQQNGLLLLLKPICKPWLVAKLHVGPESECQTAHSSLECY